MNKFIPTALLIANGGIGIGTGIGSGRLLPSVAAILALVGVVIGAMALVRSSRAGSGRGGAIAATVLGLSAWSSAPCIRPTPPAASGPAMG